MSRLSTGLFIPQGGCPALCLDFPHLPSSFITSLSVRPPSQGTGPHRHPHVKKAGYGITFLLMQSHFAHSPQMSIYYTTHKPRVCYSHKLVRRVLWNDPVQWPERSILLSRNEICLVFPLQCMDHLLHLSLTTSAKAKPGQLEVFL